MSITNSLDSIYFIKVPEGTSFSQAAFKIDSNIELPVQKKEKDASIEEDFSKLSEEQILSGILTVLAYDSGNENAQYYRDMITECRPNIKTELCEAAVLKTKNEDWDIAEEIWLALKGLDPKDMAITFNMALFFDQKADSFRSMELHEDADAYDELALSNYKACIEEDMPDAYFNAGFFYLKKNNFSEAKGCFEAYLAILSDEKDETLGENGIYKKERAQEMIDVISNRHLEDEKFHRAYQLISSGQEEKGLEEIRKFIRDNPYVWNAWFLLGWALRRMGRFEDAKQAFLKAQECDGGDENTDSLNELAICQMETGDLDAAKKTLVKALGYNSENLKILSNLGYLSEKTGDLEEARKYFELVLDLDPNDKIAKQEYDRLSN